MTFPFPLALPPWWYVTASRALTFDGTGDFANYLLRIRVQSSEFSYNGGRIRVRCVPKSATDNTYISGLYVGQQAGSGDVYDMASSPAPVQVTFGGSASVTLTAGGAAVVSDAVNFQFDKTKNHIISIGLANTANNKLRFGADGGVWNAYSLSGGAASVATLDVSGMSADGVNKSIIDQIEVLR